MAPKTKFPALEASTKRDLDIFKDMLNTLDQMAREKYKCVLPIGLLKAYAKQEKENSLKDLVASVYNGRNLKPLQRMAFSEFLEQREQEPKEKK